MKIVADILFFLWLVLYPVWGQQPVRIGIDGLSHSPVIPLLRNLNRNDIQIEGIAESSRQLLHRYAKQLTNKI